MSGWINIIPIVVAVASGFVINVFAQAQDQASPVLKFEVASIRRNTSGDNKMFANIYPGGRYTAINVPLMLLVRNAYRLQDYQLIGAPDWFSDRYDITAKAASEFPSSPRGELSPLQLAIRSLLEERFKLVVHRETRELPIYALVKARSDGKLGAELKPSTVNCEEVDAKRRLALPIEVPKPSDRVPCSLVVGFGEIAIGDSPLSSFTRALAPVVQRLVVDRSGLSGNYDLYVKWTPDEIPQGPPSPGAGPASIDSNGPSIFTALQEQLGLKLEAARGPVEVLVIDHVERPVPN
jgi:uncharacterized protein (TIGR03435 family)